MKRLASPYNLETVKSISWGITHESSAIASYCEAGGEVESTGGEFINSSCECCFRMKLILVQNS
jgi:hypothetical protein